MDKQQSVDALIVGSGIMGAIVAAQLRAAKPHARILMVDAGPRIGEATGHHLHDTPDAGARHGYRTRADGANQEEYVRAAAGDGEAAALRPGMRLLAEFGHDASEMPGASVSWNVGGMSVHWAAATPVPYGAEVPREIDPDEWDADLRTAQAMLRVHPSPYPQDALGAAVLAAIDEIVGPDSDPGRHPQPMPVAMQPQDGGELIRTGPSTIFPPVESGGDDAFELQHSTVVLRLLLEDGKAVGARVRRLADGSEETIRARAVIVCADTFRTPQLLFASGLGGPAVGRYLNEHAFLAGSVVVDRERLGVMETPALLEGEWFTAASWLPHSGDAQPFQAQIMQGPVPGSDEYATTVALYVPTELRAENRIEFDENALDAVGLPRMRVRFGYSDRDLALIERARADQARIAARLGAFDAQGPMLLEPGSSLHFTGTARLGAVDDGTSVCDPEGRVWGAEGVFVAGNAVVPTALVVNSTLAGAVTAVRAGRAAASIV